MSIERLPCEILQNIFSHIDRKADLKEYLYVCKQWYFYIKPLYYEKVHWTCKGVYFMKQYFSLGKRSRMIVFEPLPMTKTLYLSHEASDDHLEVDYGYDRRKRPSTRFGVKDLTELASLFPNLRVLNFDYSHYKLHYMKILLKLPDITILPYLEEVIATVGQGDQYYIAILYLSVCHKFRQTLKRMRIEYNYRFNIACGKDFLIKLPDFVNLKELQVDHSYGSNLTLFYILRACPPQLSTLKFSCSILTVDDAYVDGALQKMIKYYEEQGLSASICFKNLKSLTISIPLLSTPYINFLTNYCPSNLDQLTITSTEHSFFSWIKDMSLEVALKLAERLSRISNLRLAFEADTHGFSVVDRSGSVLSANSDSVNIFYQVLNALTSGRNVTDCSAFYDDYCYDRQSFTIQNNSILSYQYIIDYDYMVNDTENADNNNEENRLSQQQQNNLLPLAPNSTTVADLPVGPQTINKLQFMVKIKDMSKQFPEAHFAQAMKHCPQLTELEVKTWQHKITVKQYPFGRKSTVDDMKFIAVKGFKEHDKVFDNLAIYSPHAEIMNYEIPSYGYSCDGKEKHNDFNLNLTQFEELHTLSIDTHDMNRSPFLYVFIKFSYSGCDNDDAYFFIKRDDEDVKRRYMLPKKGYAFERSSIAFYDKCLSANPTIVYSITVKSLPKLTTFGLNMYDSLEDLRYNWKAVCFQPIMLE